MLVVNDSRSTKLIEQARMADNFWLRLRGLLGSRPLQKYEGLILVGEKSIHTLFMGFAIDVVYVDCDYKVIRTRENMLPYRLGPFLAQCAYVIEMPVGMIAESQTQIGDQLRFIPTT